MTEEETFIESHLDESMKNAITEVIMSLKDINSKYSQASLLTTVEEEDVKRFIDKHDIEVQDTSFLKQMTTPYALAKYILLKLEEKDLIKRIEEDLERNLDKEKIEWTIYRDLSKQIIFTKKRAINDDTKPQNLLIKYSVDEEDKITYTIVSGKWGWTLSIFQLKGLLENTKILENTQRLSNNKTTKDKNIVTLNYDNIEITICNKK
jgi:hypothetical protein